MYHKLKVPNYIFLFLSFRTLFCFILKLFPCSSMLIRLKNWLENQMGQTWLAGLALMNIHSKIPVSTNNIINHFAKS